MININVDKDTVISDIKPMNCINNLPSLGDTYDEQFRELKIPYSRLHDTAALERHLVDVPSIFPNFDADETKESSYDFAFTDWFMKKLYGLGTKAFYRLGVTIENYHKIKAYNIYPPKDYLKWARICEHIIAHYNEGWNDGFHYNIEYWEIWNEPEGYIEIADNKMWKGTYDEFLKFYETTSNYLKKSFPNIKIGGHGCCGFYYLFVDESEFIAKQANISPKFKYYLDCFNKFIEFCASAEHKSPLDFVSWHSYMGTEENERASEYVRNKLDECGFTDTESILDEWNPSIYERHTLRAASAIMAQMLALQDKPLDMLMYYDSRINTSYNSIFNPISVSDIGYDCPPFKGYYAFKAFSVLKELGKQVKCVYEKGQNVYAVAAYDGKNGAVLMVNDSEKRKTVRINGIKGKASYLVSKIKNLEEIAVKAEYKLNPHEFLLIKY